MMFGKIGVVGSNVLVDSIDPVPQCRLVEDLLPEQVRNISIKIVLVVLLILA